jgi:hypothetical protein
MEAEIRINENIMPNPNPKRENLKHFKTKWKHQPTKTIRVPEKFAAQLIAIAEALDNGCEVNIKL